MILQTSHIVNYRPQTNKKERKHHDKMDRRYSIY